MEKRSDGHLVFGQTVCCGRSGQTEVERSEIGRLC